MFLVLESCTDHKGDHFKAFRTLKKNDEVEALQS